MLGLHPWDIDRLTVPEFRTYIAWIDDWLKQQQGDD